MSDVPFAGRRPPHDELGKAGSAIVWFADDVSAKLRKLITRRPPPALLPSRWGPRHLELESAGDRFDSDIHEGGGVDAFVDRFVDWLSEVHAAAPVLFVVGCWLHADDAASLRDRLRVLEVAVPELEASAAAGRLPETFVVAGALLQLAQIAELPVSDALHRRLLAGCATMESGVVSQLGYSASGDELAALVACLPAISQLTFYSDMEFGIPLLLRGADPRRTIAELTTRADDVPAETRASILAAIANNAGLLRRPPDARAALRLAIDLYEQARELGGELPPYDARTLKKYERKLRRLA
ncbi:MAG: hypothetical protein R3B72_09295 [Polyangiaceae bacterium]